MFNVQSKFGWKYQASPHTFITFIKKFSMAHKALAQSELTLRHGKSKYYMVSQITMKSKT